MSVFVLLQGDSCVRQPRGLPLRSGVELLAQGTGGYVYAVNDVGVAVIQVVGGQAQAAGFVVAGNEQKSVGVTVNKIPCDGGGLGKIVHFRHGAGDVVGVAAPIDLAALDHEHETFFVLGQEL